MRELKRLEEEEEEEENDFAGLSEDRLLLLFDDDRFGVGVGTVAAAVGGAIFTSLPVGKKLLGRNLLDGKS